MAKHRRKLTLFGVASALALAVAALIVTPAGAASAATVTPKAVPVNTWVHIVNQWTRQCAKDSSWNESLPVIQEPCDWSTNPSDLSQLFQVVPTRNVNGYQLYEIKVTDTHCIDVPYYGAVPAGSVVTTYTCPTNPAADNDEWYLQYVGVLNGYETYAIRNWANWSLCLDVSGWAYNNSDLASNAKLTVYTCQGSGPNWSVNGGWDDHLWWFM